MASAFQIKWQAPLNILPVGAFSISTFEYIHECWRGSSPMVQTNNITYVTKNYTINSIGVDSDDEDDLGSVFRESLSPAVDNPLPKRDEDLDDVKSSSEDHSGLIYNDGNVSHEEDHPLSRQLSENALESEEALGIAEDQASELPDVPVRAQNEKEKKEFEGVKYVPSKEMYRARIRDDNKWKIGGLFENALDAAHAVNLLCVKFGKELRNPRIGDCPSYVRDKMVQDELCKDIFTPDITEHHLLVPDCASSQTDDMENNKAARANMLQENREALLDGSPSGVSNVSESASSEGTMLNDKQLAVPSNDIDQHTPEDILHEDSLSLSTTSPQDHPLSAEEQEEALLDGSPSGVSNVSESASSEGTMLNDKQLAVSSNDIDQHTPEDFPHEDSLSLSTTIPQDHPLSAEEQEHIPDTFQSDDSLSLSSPSITPAPTPPNLPHIVLTPTSCHECGGPCTPVEVADDGHWQDGQLYCSACWTRYRESNAIAVAPRPDPEETFPQTPRQAFPPGQVISIPHGVTPGVVTSPNPCTFSPIVTGLPTIYMTPSVSTTQTSVRSPSNLVLSPAASLSSPAGYTPFVHSPIYQQHQPTHLPPQTYVAPPHMFVQHQHMPVFAQSQPALPSPMLWREASQRQSNDDRKFAYPETPRVEKPREKAKLQASSSRNKGPSSSAKKVSKGSAKQDMIEGMCGNSYTPQFLRDYPKCENNMRHISKRLVGQFAGGKANKGEIVKAVASQLPTEKNITAYLDKNVKIICGIIHINYKYSWKEIEFNAIRTGMKKCGYHETDRSLQLCFKNNILISGDEFEKQYANEIMFNGKNVGKSKASIEGKQLRISATSESQITKMKTFFDEKDPAMPELPTPSGISFSTSSKGKDTKSCKEIIVRLGYDTRENVELAKKLLGEIFGTKKIKTLGLEEVGTKSHADSHPSSSN